jgi:methylthioribose-1-phosphate isomerase
MMGGIRQQKYVLLHGVFGSQLFDWLSDKGIKEVYFMEGRPGLEAAKQSSRELLKRKIQPTLIADNMAGFLFYKNFVKEVWVSYQSADREGALCQIGGLILGVLGKRHNVPVYAYPNGSKVKLFGSSKEIAFFNGVKVAPRGVPGYVPLAEWVPSKYITKVYNGKGIS